MMTIGEFSRASGLTVSALRFYDSVGVLVPVQVDPRTNYRWYAQSQVGDGRLVARLLRVGPGLPQVTPGRGCYQPRPTANSWNADHFVSRLQSVLLGPSCERVRKPTATVSLRDEFAQNAVARVTVWWVICLVRGWGC